MKNISSAAAYVGTPASTPSPSEPPPSDDRTDAARFDKYYTCDDVAEHCLHVVKTYFEMNMHRWIEPSAGDGAFLRVMPQGSRGYDIAPKRGTGIKRADFLKLTFRRTRPIAFLGNPPFGKNASLAIKFFNHAATQGDVIAFILPRSFRKASIQNRLNRHFHLVHDEDVPPDAFRFCGAPYHVQTVFQIWVRRDAERPLYPVEMNHPDFEFTTPARAHFVVQRVGARAGRIHRNFKASPNSHYFIRSVARPWRDLRMVMENLDFARAASNVVGNPSLAKSEIVALYRCRVGV